MSFSFYLHKVEKIGPNLNTPPDVCLIASVPTSITRLCMESKEMKTHKENQIRMLIQSAIATICVDF